MKQMRERHLTRSHEKIVIFVVIFLSLLLMRKDKSDRTPRCNTHVSAMVDCNSYAPRTFFHPMCDETYTIPDLFIDFSVHQVEWSIMGKTQAFWSVLVDFPKDDDDVSQKMVENFYASGWPRGY